MQKLKTNTFLKTINREAKRKKQKVFLVGGYVRDLMLERTKENYDLDFAVDKNAIAFAKTIARAIKGNFVLLDKEHGCARVVYNKKHCSHTFDFADFRGPTIESDLLQRDFTINSLAIDINSIEKAKKFNQILLDCCSALDDLKRKKVRMASKESFDQDPLRIVRAFSFSAMLDFEIDSATLKAIKRKREKLLQSAEERKRDELFKIFTVNHSAPRIKQMDTIGVLEKVIPQIKIMRNVSQGPYHHLDVWKHSLETLVQLEKLFQQIKGDAELNAYLDQEIVPNRTRRSLMKLGALLHDIGKPEAKKRKDGKMIFHGHERVGRRIIDSIAEMLKLSTKEKFALEKMIFWHLRPGYLANTKMPTQRAVFRYFRDTEEEGVSILIIGIADQRSTRGPLTDKSDRKHHEKVVRGLIKYYFDKQKEEPFVRLIDGNDLIKKLKLSPSPIFATILREVEEAQAEGSITTKKQALELARKLAKK
ncbi:HD domain-containing protein [Candidatus Omnitrophota bacterium]